MWLTVDRDRRSDDFHPTAESVGPRSVTQKHDAIVAVDLLVISKRAAKQRVCSEHKEDGGRRACGAESDWSVVDHDVRGRPEEPAKCVERRDALAKFAEVRRIRPPRV